MTSISSTAQILAASDQALHFAQKALPKHAIVDGEWKTTPLVLPKLDRSRTKSLAVISATPAASAWRMIRSLATRLYATRPSIQIVVVGETFDDGRLMSHPNMLVTGPVAADELSDALAAHNVAWLFSDFEAPLFGHPLLESARTAN